MTTTFRCKLKGENEELVMRVVNGVGTTKEEFMEKAMVLLATDVEVQIRKRLEDMELEDNRQAAEAAGQEEEVQPQVDSGEDTPE